MTPLEVINGLLLHQKIFLAQDTEKVNSWKLTFERRETEKKIKKEKVTTTRKRAILCVLINNKNGK